MKSLQNMTSYKVALLVAVVALAGLAGLPNAYASILHVPRDHGTIQQAINASAAGDTVLIEPGHYSEYFDYNGHEITVGSLYLTTGNTAFVAQTVIDAEELETVVQIASGEGETTRLSGLTLQNGNGALGGGLFIRVSNPRLDHLIIQDNYGHSGGGIYLDRGSNVVIADCEISGNSSYLSSFGGGIYCVDNCNLTVTNCQIVNNGAYLGGGIAANEDCRVSLSNVILENNHGSQGHECDHGGGIYIYDGCFLELDRVQILSNTATQGGGIYSDRSEMRLNNTLISDNVATSVGGGVYCDGPAVIENTIVINNSAAYNGGGFILGSQSVTMVRTVVAANSAGRIGGGIWFDGYSGDENMMNLLFTVVALNSAGDYGGAMYFKDGSSILLFGGVVWENSPQQIYCPRDRDLNRLIVAYSYIDGGEDVIVGNHNLDLVWLDGNIDADPSFVDPQGGDFNIRNGSPCVDAATAFFVYDGDTLLNLSRNEYIGNAPDIGAFESEYQSVSDESLIPQYPTLLPAYPNPFNSGAVIPFELSNPAEVSLRIYDAEGRVVFNLANGIFSAGYHSVSFNGSGLPGGTYVYSLEAGKAVGSGRLILVK